MDIVKQNYDRWLSSDVVPESDKEIMRNMSQEEKDMSFFKYIEFGTGGMRGILGPGTNKINNFTVRRVTIGLGQYLLDKFPNAKEMGVALSHDNRHMSREFVLLCAKVLNEQGIKAYVFDDLRPTPELSYAVRLKGCCAGIMVTASHNPKEYNGYKVYDEKGCQLVPAKMDDLFEFINKLDDELNVKVEPKADMPAETIVLEPEVDTTYCQQVETVQLNPKLVKKGYKIVYTPNHGASYENAMRVFKECGYDVTPVEKQCTHDPDFSGTLCPNPEDERAYIEPLKIANQIDADLIVMTDPDGDRCGLAYKSSNGGYERLNGNQSGALLIDYLLKERMSKGILSDNGVIYDTMVTSDLGRKVAKAYGVGVETFLTGFKYIGDRIAHYEELGEGPHFEFGYEESYGCLIDPFVRDKDGIQAILMYCEMALYYHLKGMPLDVAYEALQQRFGHHFTQTDNVVFKGSEGAEEMEKIMHELYYNSPKSIGGIKVVMIEDFKNQKRIYPNKEEVMDHLPVADAIKLYLEDGSWMAVRPSGTEPKCKFYCEAVDKTNQSAERKGLKLLKSLKETFGIN